MAADDKSQMLSFIGVIVCLAVIANPAWTWQWLFVILLMMLCVGEGKSVSAEIARNAEMRQAELTREVVKALDALVNCRTKLVRPDSDTERFFTDEEVQALKRAESVLKEVA